MKKLGISLFGLSMLFSMITYGQETIPETDEIPNITTEYRTADEWKNANVISAMV